MANDNVLRDSTIVLTHVIDVKTQQPVVLDLSGYTLPQRFKLHNLKRNMAETVKYFKNLGC